MRISHFFECHDIPLEVSHYCSSSTILSIVSINNCTHAVFLQCLSCSLPFINNMKPASTLFHKFSQFFIFTDKSFSGYDIIELISTGEKDSSGLEGLFSKQVSNSVHVLVLNSIFLPSPQCEMCDASGYVWLHIFSEERKIMKSWSVNHRHVFSSDLVAFRYTCA